MASFGFGVYLLTVIWFLTLLLCWVSVKTGHYIGKVSVGVSVLLTLMLVILPKGDLNYEHGANFYDRLFIPRYVILAFLSLSAAVGCVYAFIHNCLTPVETRKLRTFASVN